MTPHTKKSLLTHGLNKCSEFVKLCDSVVIPGLTRYPVYKFRHIGGSFLALLFFSTQLTAGTDPGLYDPAALETNNILYLEQNWTEEDRQFFYYTDQGSRLLPYDIFLNLEQADNEELFRSPAYMLRLGFIPGEVSAANPDGLAIGFSRNADFMGPTCAACHTQQLKYGNKIIRIDGGQAMMDLPMFLRALVASMQKTLEDEAKFTRFQVRLLGENASAKEVETLRKRLKQQYEKRKDYNRRNNTEVPNGFSRLDAFGAILNTGLYLSGVKDNFNSPDAPTSYPYIWDSPQHDYVEWNGSQTNSSLGALARNVGEVIGVFGDVIPETKLWLAYFDGGYESSIQADNLRNLEKVTVKLQSPLWPDIFPKIDAKKASMGRELYVQHCGQCHVDINRSDPERKIRVRMSSLEKIQTDPLMAKNAVELKGKSGIFEGRKRFYTVGGVLGKEAPALYIVNNVMGGVLKNNFLQVLLAKNDAMALGHPKELHPPKYLDGEIVERGKEVANLTLLAYKARPLNGIWATAPYLHNGSVPNLYELLLPANERAKEFYISSLEYDTTKVGYLSTPAANAFRFDTTLRGNSNAGHEYGRGEYGKIPFTEEEIQALVEYMKTL
jgi:RoxA-like, cytochrome c-like